MTEKKAKRSNPWPSWMAGDGDLGARLLGDNPGINERRIGTEMGHHQIRTSDEIKDHRVDR